MGFRGLHKVGLAAARKKAADARLLLSEGRDPIEYRRSKNASVQPQRSWPRLRSMTFDQCAEAYIDAHEAGWKNENTGNNGETRSNHMFLQSSGRWRCRTSTSIL